MPNPVKRHSKTRRNTRRAHDFLKSPALSVCPQCNEPKMPHRVCPTCGTYKGREVIAAEKIS
ncbi:MAG: 50S ribosomal protein L32 [Syntrophaceae bacterium]|jgi:large subunit ribosomal protein L32|nr:50S ribosomal protein L32 [Syntrophaceae bacterium]HOC59537.1 50S ribosomal protein L32 [Smithellaceae bacterium]HQM45185.1 50S ribosomal protein L32 [Smithellaceae bacterium]